MKNSNAAFDNVKVASDNDENDNTNECISMNILINSMVINSSKNLTPTSGLSRQHTNQIVVKGTQSRMLEAGLAWFIWKYGIKHSI